MTTTQQKHQTTFKDLIRFSWHYWRRQKLSFFLCIAGMLCAGAIDALFPVLTGHLINTITNPEAAGWSRTLTLAFIAFIAVELAYHTVRMGTDFIWTRFASKNLNDILTELFHKVQRFSTDWHANEFAGATVRKITRGMWSFDQFEDIILIYLLPTGAVMVGTITFMAIKWPLMGLVTFIAITLFIIVNVTLVLKLNAPRFRTAAAHDTEVGGTLADAITANATVKSFGRERAEDSRFGGVATRWRLNFLSAWQWKVGTDLIRRYMSTLMLACMVGTAIYLWTEGEATAGDVVYVFTAYLVLSNYLKGIGEQIANLLKSVSEMDDAIAFWMREDEIRDAPDAKIFTPTVGGIVFDGVHFAYENQGKGGVYQDLSVTIDPGEQVALVGASGSGKSTFVKLVQRLYDVTGGEIRIDGQNIAHVTQESLRRNVALVPQEPILFHRSLAENIAYGKPGAGMEEIIAAAEKAYAHEFIQDLPHGYDTLVGERGIKLSGGERQRVAIARAILADAPILILDEATSALDSISEHYIQLALKNLVEGKTVITIAHRLATIKHVDRILVFDRGDIVEQGTHRQLVSRAASHYKQLYEMQALDLTG